MRATATGGAPNRLTKDGANALRWSGSGNAVARALGKAPSHYTRVLSGERQTVLAKTEEIVRAMAKDGKVCPFVFIAHLRAAAQEEFEKLHRHIELSAVIYEETEAEGADRLAEIALLDGATPHEIERAIKTKTVLSARIDRTLAVLRTRAERRTR